MTTFFKTESRISWRVRIGLILLLIAFGAIGWLYYQRISEKAEIEKQLQIWIEAQAEKDRQRVTEQKEAVNQAAENTNQARNANYSNLSDDELRRRLIEKARELR